MSHYYYSDGSNTLGPYTIEELQKKNITKNTLIFFQDSGEWTPAGSIPELADLFKSDTTIINSDFTLNTDSHPNMQKTPKTWLVPAILATLLFVPFGIAGIVNASRVKSRFYAGDIEGAKRASHYAQQWTIYSFLMGFFIAIPYFIVWIVSSF